MGDFLETINLTPELRANLRKLDMGDPEAVVVLTASEIVAEASKAGFEISLGKAGLLLAKARDEVSKLKQVEADRAASDRRIEMQVAALEHFNKNGHVGTLTAAGLTYVVVRADDKLDANKTIGLMVDLERGAPLPAMWQGMRVVPVSQLDVAKILCHPRTGVALQGDPGVDDNGVLWGELKLEGLRLAAFGYEQGKFHGMTDKAVLLALTTDADLRSDLTARAKALKIDLATMDRRVVYAPPSRPHYEAPTPATPYCIAQPAGLGPIPRLAELLKRMFQADEMRRFVSYLPDGRAMVDQLPGANTSPAVLFPTVAEVLSAHGMINRTLRDRLVAERSRRADEIDAFFNSIL